MPNVLTFLMSMLVNSEQSRKADSPIEVTEFEKVTEVSPEQPLKAYLPIEVTELGIVTEVSLEQPRKAKSGIIETLSPIDKDERFVQPLNT